MATHAQAYLLMDSQREHDRLSALYRTDKFAFELERKRLIDTTIDSALCSDTYKAKLRHQQSEWNRMLKGIGSVENRFPLIQALLGHHLVNSWQSALVGYRDALNAFEQLNSNRPQLSLVKKEGHAKGMEPSSF